MEKLPTKQSQHRESLYQGLLVDIVLKQDQKTMTLTRGYIKDFLTSKDFHPRGLKVRLHKEGIKRLYDTSHLSKIKDVDYSKEYKDEDFIGRVQRTHYPICHGILILNKMGNKITDNFYNLFLSHYNENSYIVIENNNEFNDSFESHLSNIQKPIDFILNEDSHKIFKNNLYQSILSYSQITGKEINFYLYTNDKFINIQNGKEKKKYI